MGLIRTKRHENPFLKWFMQKLSTCYSDSGYALTHEEMALLLGVSKHTVHQLALGYPCHRRLTLRMADRLQLPRVLFLKASGYEPKAIDWAWDHQHYGVDEDWSRTILSVIPEASKPIASASNFTSIQIKEQERTIQFLCLLLIPLLILLCVLLIIPDIK